MLAQQDQIDLNQGLVLLSQLPLFREFFEHQPLFRIDVRMIDDREVLTHLEEFLVEVFEKLPLQLTDLVNEDLNLDAIVFPFVLTVILHDFRGAHGEPRGDICLRSLREVFRDQIQNVATHVNE